MNNQIPEGFWRDAKGCLVPESMIKPIDRTRDELTKTEAELKAVKGELKAERLKNSAAEVGTTIIDGIGAMIGTSKVKRQEQEIDRLQHEVAARDESIESLQKKITTMQSDHSRELTTMQARHATELTNKEKQHEKRSQLRLFCRRQPPKLDRQSRTAINRWRILQRIHRIKTHTTSCIRDCTYCVRYFTFS